MKRTPRSVRSPSLFIANSERGGGELRIGCSGVPLALAPELYRRVMINREPLSKAVRELGLTREVAQRMRTLFKRHRLPSTARLVVLSAGYPDRTAADIAARFSLTVDEVLAILSRADEIRGREPLVSEMWEDITPDDMSQEEIQQRAKEVRQQNVDQGKVSGGPRRGPEG